MRRRGSLTVFAALSLMLVAQLLFTMLEAARHYELQKVLRMNSETALESIFADYCSPLWETYHILGVTAADAEGQFSLNGTEAELRELTAAALGSGDNAARLSGIHLLTADMTDAQFTRYRLLTDEEGAVFCSAVCSYMKQNLAYETAKSVYDSYKEAESAKESSGDTDAAISGGLDALRQPDGTTLKGASATNRSLKDAESTADTSADNPMEVVTEVKKSGVLSLVLPDSAQISGKSLTLDDTVSHRSLQSGTAEGSTDNSWYDRVLLEQYLTSYLGCYTAQKDGRALQYELEYLIGGKASDEKNLKAVVTELLVTREALNLAALTASASKQAEAESLALLLAGISVNPLVIEAVKAGILAAWAYAESVLDVRALLSGGKISLIKSDAEWTSNIHAIPELLSGWSVAKDCSAGLDYQSYLGILLLTKSEKTLAMRTMDVQEQYVRLQDGYEQFRMDHAICEAELTATYEFRPVFLGFVTLIGQTTDSFRIQNTTSYSYLEGKEGA